MPEGFSSDYFQLVLARQRGIFILQGIRIPIRNGRNIVLQRQIPPLTSPAKGLFCNLKQYAVIAVKNIGFPLFAFATLYFIPVEGYLKQALFVICCCPVANMVLSFSERLGEGQKTAANVVLLSTISCLLTLPVMCLMLQLLA